MFVNYSLQLLLDTLYTFILFYKDFVFFSTDHINRIAKKYCFITFFLLLLLRHALGFYRTVI